MRATTLSTAALCSLGVLAAYGISNRVNSTPQPDPAEEKPTSEPAIVPALSTTLPIAKTIAPPETLTSASGSIAKGLTQERQQRESQLAADLAQVSVPAPPPLGALDLASAIPSAESLLLDKIVTRSVNSTALSASKATFAAEPQLGVRTSAQTTRQISLPPPPITVPIFIRVPVAARPPAATPPIEPVEQATIEASTEPATSISTATSIAVDLAADPTAAVTATTATAAQPLETTPVGITQPQPSTAVQPILPSAQPTASRQNFTASPAPAAPSSAPTLIGAVVASSAAPTASAPTASVPTASAPTALISASAARQSQPEAPIARAIAPTQTAQPTQAAQPIVTSTATQAAAVNEAYTLGPGDQLSLQFFNAPEYDGEVQVLSDGTLNLPIVGNFSVAGMTLQQAEAEIAARYQTELRYSVVTVSLKQARALQVAIVGEVQQPGSYTLAQEGAQFPGIVQAIKQAGGTTQAADLRNIQVRRSNRSSPNQVIAVNLVDLLQTGDLRQDLKLRDGDQIVIPTAAVVNFAEAPQVAAANFAADPSQPIDVAIVGEVFRPGSYEMGGSGRSSLTEVIQQAGGVKPTANIREIQVRRSTRTGAEQVINIDLGQLIQSGNISQDLTLQQGDRISIPTATRLTPAETTLLSAANLSPEVMKVNVVGEVKSPGIVQVPPGSTLNQVLLAAGGLNNRATRELEVIRLEPNGTLTRRTIKMEIKQGFNTDINPLLMHNDIVVVGRSGTAQLADQLGQINSVVGPILQLVPFSLPSF